MKNLEIYEGLHNVELRNFIGRTLTRANWKFPIKQIEALEIAIELERNSNNNIWQITILNSKIDIVKAQDRLKYSETMYALGLIMKMFGYEEFDIPDDIEDYNPETYVPFIGTQKEFKDLLKKHQK